MRAVYRINGYSIVKNGVAALTGTGSQYPQGWADLSDSSGAGVEIGHYLLAAYGNKSLEFNGGGKDVRIGIFARENNTTSTASTSANHPYYMPWPQWSINDVYLNFHAAAGTARQRLPETSALPGGLSAPSYYNSCNVFTYPSWTRLKKTATTLPWYRAHRRRLPRPPSRI